ncbi:hypothetical protein PENTCL1PPCAC_6260 [Pristionchus entomophagus]|uniref:Transmembrane protein 144 n=1 Tax=Pristionchus entomophagus TaxID=358040 RepID=A0AAV5SNE9_9BILA|nr:hypothetical protein PENTCL1PPCAC_6260 [Pristionchus entomophagus]
MSSSSLSTTDIVIGYVACLVSCIGFGTMFVPLRKADCRDGFFVQWVQCSVVFLFGFFINIARGFPSFNYIPAIGGVLYATGNVFSVPIIEGIGVGLGMLIWGTIQVLVGWGVARFGIFDLLSPSPTAHDVLNYVGMAVTVVCGILFVFVRHNEEEKEEEEKQNKDSEITVEMEEINSNKQQEKPVVQNAKAAAVKKIPYLIMACCLGVLHGLMMSPVDIAKQRTPEENKADKYHMFDFVFSYFSTVFAFSTLYFIVYCIVRRGKAHVKAELVVPSVIYGCLWSVGMTLWFLSADRLAQTVAYPITTRLPAIIGALIDVLIYRSIQGRKNIAYFAFVIVLGIIGVVLIALSNA